MNDLISRKWLMECVNEGWIKFDTEKDKNIYVHLVRDIAPSAQPERPNGHWVEVGDEPYDEWECDVCGFVIDGSGCVDPEEYRDVYKYCPRCGSDMRGEQDDESRSKSNAQTDTRARGMGTTDKSSGI